MRPELEKKLLKKYPKIFVQHSLSCKETAMCWGFECGDGWYDLINLLCSSLQWDIDKNAYPQIEAVQVKEKFGTLRFYYGYTDDAKVKDEERKMGVQDGMIGLAEQLSQYICYHCGTNQKIGSTKGWITYCCEDCAKKNEKRNWSLDEV